MTLEPNNISDSVVCVFGIDFTLLVILLISLSSLVRASHTYMSLEVEVEDI